MYDDEFAGQGGSYEIGSDGKRKLVERTNMQSSVSEQPPQPGEQTTKTDPA